MLFDEIRPVSQEIREVKTFRIKPSDWQEVERVAALYGRAPSVFVRMLVLMGLEVARERLSERRP